MENKIVLFAGGTSGLGKIAVCDLANKGATVIVTSRNKKKGKELIDYFKQNFTNAKGKIDLLDCNLSSFQSITAAVEKFKKEYNRIDILINNAGLWKNKFEETVDKVEETFHVNVLVPLLLSDLLVEMLGKSTDAKIIFTSSGLHQGEIQFDDIEYRKDFKGFNAYRQSKLGIILLSRLVAKKLADKNIGVYSQHPGVVKTELARESNLVMRTIFLSMGISPQKGAKTLIYLATESKENLKSGEYYYKNKVTKTTPESNDLDVAEKLLELSKKYLKNWIDGSSELLN